MNKESWTDSIDYDVGQENYLTAIECDVSAGYIAIGAWLQLQP